MLAQKLQLPLPRACLTGQQLATNAHSALCRLSHVLIPHSLVYPGYSCISYVSDLLRSFPSLFELSTANMRATSSRSTRDTMSAVAITYQTHPVRLDFVRYHSKHAPHIFDSLYILHLLPTWL